MSPRKNPFSKTTITLLVTVAVLIVIATVLLCVGGTLAGWNIGEKLRSPTAILIYAIIGLVAVVVGFKLYSNRR